MTLLFKTNAALLRVSLNQKILPQVGQQSKHTMISSNVTHLLIWIGPDKKKSHSDFNEYTRQSCVCTAMPKKIKLLIGGDPLLKTDLCLIKREKICEGEDKHRWKLLFWLILTNGSKMCLFFSFSWYSSKVAMIKTIPKWAIFIPQNPSSYVSHIVLSFPSSSDFFVHPSLFGETKSFSLV